MGLYQLTFLLVTVGLRLSLGLESAPQRTNHRLILSPNSDSEFNLHDQVSISCNLTNTTLQYISSKNSSRFYLGIKHEKNKIKARNVVSIHSDVLPLYTSNGTSYYKLSEDGNVFFTADMSQIGYARAEISLVEITPDNKTELLSVEEYKMKCKRPVRQVDTGFNVSITVVVILNTFALGCVTDIEDLRQIKQRKVNILIALLTQYLAIPMVSRTDELTSMLEGLPV